MRDASRAFGHTDVKLGLMPLQRINGLGALLDQEITSMEREATAWAALLLGATKRMIGRWAASQITSASAASFFCRLTNDLT